MSYDQKNSSQKNIGIAFLLNLSFAILEVVGGYLTNSIAIIADALHDLGDSLSLGLSWYFSKVSTKGRTKTFSYGYVRFSLLAAYINGIVLLLGSVFILAAAIPRLIQPESTNAKGMLILAFFGIIVNGFAVLRLKKGKTLNEQVVFWHLMEDVLGWIAVFVTSIVMIFTKFDILDPILSVLITFYILWNAVKNLKKTVKVFLQSTPDSIDVQEIEEKILEIDLVEGIHDTHIWSFDGASHVLTTHLVIHQDLPAQEIIRVKRYVREIVEKFNIYHATIEMEHSNEECKLKNC